MLLRQLYLAHYEGRRFERALEVQFSSSGSKFWSTWPTRTQPVLARPSATSARR
jgi:hypothetical protein